MGKAKKPLTILMADDDEEDRMMTGEVLEEVSPANRLRFVRDGEELMEYLYRRGDYADPAEAPRPSLLLLDLKMPRKDGHEALREIRADPGFRSMPVVVLTSSKAEEDLRRAYELGVNSFITKPADFSGLVGVMEAVATYWFETVELPPVCEAGRWAAGNQTPSRRRGQEQSNLE